jgi:hypothetical protein
MCGGYHSWRDTSYTMLRDGYYWLKLFSEVNAKVRSCKESQIFVGKQKLLSLTLVPIKYEAPFQQWGLEFIGEIHPASTTKNKWILNATYYFSKWVEAIPRKFDTDVVVIKFLEENILVRFVCPKKMITDNVQDFKSLAMIYFCKKYNIILGHSTSYYPQDCWITERGGESIIEQL